MLKILDFKKVSGNLTYREGWGGGQFLKNIGLHPTL